MKQLLSLGIFSCFLVSCKDSSMTNSVTVAATPYLFTDTTSELGSFGFFRIQDSGALANKQGVRFLGKIYAGSDQSTETIDSILFGVYESDKMFYAKIDTDGDGDLRNEHAYSCNSKTKLKVVRSSFHGDSILNSEIYVIPTISQMKIDGVTNSPISDVGLRILALRKAIDLNVDGKSYRVTFHNLYDRLYNDRNTTFFPTYMRVETDYLHAANVGDTLYINKRPIVIEGIDSAGKFVKLTYLNKLREQLGYNYGDVALSSTFRALNGNVVNIGGKKASFTLIDFWGTWCKPCLALTDDLKGLHHKYKTKLDFIGVAFDNDSSSVKQYLEQKKVEWPNVFDLMDDSHIARKYNVKSFPTFILIDRTGTIVFRGTGDKDFSSMKKLLQAELRD